MHSHNDKKIKICKTCLSNIKKIQKSTSQLEKSGTWTLPEKIEKNITYTIWTAKKSRIKQEW